MSHEPSRTAPRKPWYKRWWAIAIGAVVVIAAIGNLMPNTDDPEPAAAAPTPTVTEQAETPEPTPSASAESTEDAEPLATQVETAILESNGVTSFQALEPTSPGYWISELEDVSTGTIRVHLSDTFTKAEQAETAKWVANMSCTKAPTLDTIVTRDSNGVDQNNYTRDLNILPACK